jgi:hypothetical protein
VAHDVDRVRQVEQQQPHHERVERIGVAEAAGVAGHERDVRRAPRRRDAE